MTQRILIADSGSTKTAWALLEGPREVGQWHTQGLNPFMLTSADIETVLRTELPVLEGVSAVAFYGAGCRGTQSDVVRQALQRVFPAATASVESDLLGAARALCGSDAGIACILGTGSNSCLYDGVQLVANVPPLGYVLGDEGSGAALGKRLVGHVLKGLFPAALTSAFFASCDLTSDDIIRRVYREPLPNRFLASFAPFLAQHRESEAVQALIGAEFDAFFTRNVCQYGGVGGAVHFVGSVAFHFRDELSAAAARHGYALGRVLRTPLEGLVRYHCAHG